MCTKVKQNVDTTEITSSKKEIFGGNDIGEKISCDIYRCDIYRLSELQALECLQKVTKNPNATWKSPLQLEAIKHVYAEEHDILLVMATGGGKTMAIIIPTLMDDSVSVIVLPLNSLITDYKRKFDEMELKYDSYTNNTKTLRQDVNFIFVSADLAKTNSWKQCIMNLDECAEVSRLFFDEAHIPLLSKGFRPSLNHLSDLRVLNIQFTLLTATAPPSSEDALYKLFGLLPTNTLTL